MAGIIKLQLKEPFSCQLLTGQKNSWRTHLLKWCWLTGVTEPACPSAPAPNQATGRLNIDPKYWHLRQKDILYSSLACARCLHFLSFRVGGWLTTPSSRPSRDKKTKPEREYQMREGWGDTSFVLFKEQILVASAACKNWNALLTRCISLLSYAFLQEICATTRRTLFGSSESWILKLLLWKDFSFCFKKNCCSLFRDCAAESVSFVIAACRFYMLDTTAVSRFPSLTEDADCSFFSRCQSIPVSVAHH